MSEIHSTATPSKLLSKDAAARSLGCDRRTLSRIIDTYDIASAGISAAGHPLYELEDLREALAEHRAASLPPMTAEEATDSIFSMMELGWLALDYLAEILPPETMQDALDTAMQRRKEKQEPQFIWLRQSSLPS